MAQNPRLTETEYGVAAQQQPGTPDTPTPRTDAEIDARILPEARTGNTDRWEKTKVPSDTAYIGDIAAQARSNAQTRWPKERLPSDIAYDGDLADVATSGD